MDVGTRVEMDQVERDLKAAHYAIPNTVRGALKESVEDIGLPAIRTASPSFARPLLTARSSMRVGYVTTRGSKQLDRALGLLNYGGTVRGKIEPRRVARDRTLGDLQAAIPSVRAPAGRGPKALGLPGGPRAAVNKPRHYRGKHFLETTGAAITPAVGGVFRDKVLAIYGERGWTTERSGL